MNPVETQLIERLRALPPDRVAEVVDFVEFLATREDRAAAVKRLTDVFARLDALGLPAISEDEVEEEIQALRRERRGA